jgi:hypothetical protein
MARQGASAHDPLKTPTENDAGIRCVLLYPINGTPRIHATVSVWNGALHIGVGFMATRPKNAPQEMDDLEGSLRHEGLRPERDPKGREHWLSSKPCDVILNERGFLIHWEIPRLCRGGSRSLTFPGVVPGCPSTKLQSLRGNGARVSTR